MLLHNSVANKILFFPPSTQWHVHEISLLHLLLGATRVRVQRDGVEQKFLGGRKSGHNVLC
jgi:hypothetical protein